MRGILADINVGRQRPAILAIWASETWRPGLASVAGLAASANS